MTARFIQHIVSEAQRRRSLTRLRDEDLNAGCSELHPKPIDITPSVFPARELPDTLSTRVVRPARADAEEHWPKASMMVQSMHNIKHQAVFEIAGNRQCIECLFHAELHDLDTIEAAVLNSFPHTVVAPAVRTPLGANHQVYDLIPDAPFYTCFTSYEDLPVSPLNVIFDILSQLPDDTWGAYQVICVPLPSECYELVQMFADAHWQASAPVGERVPPSYQRAPQEEVDFKAPRCRSLFAACMRILLPTDVPEANVRAFSASYVYGRRSLRLLTSSDYTASQIQQMATAKSAFHRGFVVNAVELTSILHLPFDGLDRQTPRQLLKQAPPGDRPQESSHYADVPIGLWAGDSATEVCLPIAMRVPHVQCMGVSRTGKSVLLSHLVMRKFLTGQATFVLDPHGDLVVSILRMVPKHRIDDVVVIDFGLERTPRVTIRSNVDLSNPSKIADDLSEGMRNVTISSDALYGVRMGWIFASLFFIYSVVPELSLPELRLLMSPSQRGKNLRNKVRAKVQHPIVRDFLTEIDATPYEALLPAMTRLSHLLLDEKNLRLFTLEENRISIGDIIRKAQLCLVNLNTAAIGKQRSSVLAGVIDTLITNNAIARGTLPYSQRQPPINVVVDEFHLTPVDVDAKLSGFAKLNYNLILSHQYTRQVEDQTREVLSTAGTRIFFRLRPEDAYMVGRELGIEPAELADLRRFEAIVRTEDEVVKILTPKPDFPDCDWSRQIMDNCLDKYYTDAPRPTSAKRAQLTFDTLT